jgi:hypothetical protein
MTPDQERQFEDFGCASRCLIALANERGARVTKAAFIDRYTSNYWLNSNRCGLLPTTREIKEVALDLGLARDIQESSDFSIVRAQIRNHSISSLMVCTKKKYEADGSLSPYGHCTLVSPSALQGDDFLYLLEVDYITPHCKGLYLPESAISPLIPAFLLFNL